ncbi:DUF4345 family protein [Antarctobacter jejuensis]|uniref:DUF4345 family protein n=1 Tax=Antarctobacter jejuensis TaxID=1439938 RepID=UPI003FD4284F
MYIDAAIALITIAFGAIGFVAPRYAAEALDLTPQGTTMGLSELRASAGGLFVALGLFCLITGRPEAYTMLGIAYAGASTGRLISMIMDKPPQPKALIWFAFEAGPAAWLILMHAPEWL